MGSIKDYLIELQNERSEEWIRSKLEDKNADVGSEEWVALAQEYDEYQDYLIDEAEHESELRWLRENGSSQIHKFFIRELDDLEKVTQNSLENRSDLIVTAINSQMIKKMAFSYSVTLLETFLGDTLKSLINENENLLENAINNVEELKKAKFTLAELQRKPVDVKTLSSRKISEILFHNIPKVKKVYEEVLGVHLDVDVSNITRIVSLRHHIVHRNGRTLNDREIILTAEDLKETIEEIRSFTKSLQVELNKHLYPC